MLQVKDDEEEEEEEVEEEEKEEKTTHYKVTARIESKKTVRVRDNVLGSGQVQIFELLTGSVFALLAPPPPSPPSALPPRPAPSSASYTTPNNDVRVHTTSRRNANRVHRAAATLAIENHQKLRAEFVCFRQISPWRSEEEEKEEEEEEEDEDEEEENKEEKEGVRRKGGEGGGGKARKTVLRQSLRRCNRSHAPIRFTRRFTACARPLRRM
ncbi:hypothetical protein V1477_000350 [Vespula maculifrons]|uniref:Uncharacterized protein n=1 Tax=Vespula maculifrons TaxID=7453 RepID=A0ABD2D1D3_VESMC